MSEHTRGDPGGQVRATVTGIPVKWDTQRLSALIRGWDPGSLVTARLVDTDRAVMREVTVLTDLQVPQGHLKKQQGR